ncbi:transporter [Novosphingobium rosa]|uniref:transporter n=1 Tax=Novosphingobium rosa TaxID=76978 RepID=UPI00082B5E5D|nr:transporter [Novosphingobium rosa]
MTYERIATCVSIALAMGCVAQARASDITFAVINPHEYDLPTDGYRPFNAVVEYGEYNNGTQQFDNAGHRIKGPDTDLYASLTKLVHFWTFDGLPNVGFAYEVIQPTVHLDGPGLNKTGFGDTLTGPAIWVKPTKNTVLGFQTFASIPVGSSNITNHYWANYSSFFFDAEIKKHLSLTGDIGAIFRGRQQVVDGPNIAPGNSYHFNIRASWRSKSKFEPFVAFDWQQNKKSRYVGGADIPFSDGHETTWGVGTLYAVNKKLSLVARYSRSIEGRNVTMTNAVYASLIKVF